jgi:hypothetical protein
MKSRMVAVLIYLGMVLGFYCTGRYLADFAIFAQNWLEGMPL